MHAITSLTTPYKYKERKVNTMNTIQDTPVRKRIINLLKHDDLVARGCTAPVRKRTINLLDHPDLVAGSGELVKLQDQIHRARKKNYDPQSLTQLETRYATMKQEFDLALKKAQTRQQ